MRYQNVNSTVSWSQNYQRCSFTLPAFSKCFISPGLIIFINYYAVLVLSQKDKNQSLLCRTYIGNFKDTNKQNKQDQMEAIADRDKYSYVIIMLNANS